MGTTEQRQRDQSSNTNNLRKPMNPYEILQISPPTPNNNYDKDELKQAYRKLAFKFHPDVVIGDDNKILANEAFSKINEAYNTLLNDSRTAATTARGSTTTSSYRAPAAVGQYEEEYFYPR